MHVEDLLIVEALRIIHVDGLRTVRRYLVTVHMNPALNVVKVADSLT